MIPADIAQYTLSVVASFGTLAAALLPLLKNLREEHLRKPSKAGKYFEDLATTLTSVAHELRENKVPRVDGTHLNGLLQTFGQNVTGISDEKLPPTLETSLIAAAQTAKTLDAWALDRIQLDDEQREILLASLERAAGACKTLASRLRQDA